VLGVPPGIRRFEAVLWRSMWLWIRNARPALSRRGQSSADNRDGRRHACCCNSRQAEVAWRRQERYLEQS
jgi:hypothetical protein